MRISCGLIPGPHCIAQAQLAEELGYERVWLADSIAIYEDLFIWLGQLARSTERIGLGTGVLVPHTRHLMTTASSIATMEELAPGRMAYAFGTGASARWVIGKKPLTLKYVRNYMVALRGLLRGEVVEYDGAQMQMIHRPGLAPARPIDVPLLLSAAGPKGQAIAREIADGLMTFSGGVPGWDWHVQLVSGTVLADGETIESDRVKAAVGPWYTVIYHGMWEGDPTSVDMMPEGAAWRGAIEAERPDGQRHLAVHEGHVTEVTERDRAIVAAAGDALAMMSWVGDAETLRAQVAAAADEGTSEIMYWPAGPDVPGELRRFAEAVG
jgi:5,10-methylenetetrahydromethanopterin reductase